MYLHINTLIIPLCFSILRLCVYKYNINIIGLDTKTLEKILLISSAFHNFPNIKILNLCSQSLNCVHQNLFQYEYFSNELK